MTHRCNHCQAENLVADNLAPGATAPMCMRCGQAMQLTPAHADPAPATASAEGKLTNLAAGAAAAAGFEGSTVMVMRPNFAPTASSAAGAPTAPAAAAAAAVDEAWYALVNGAQEGPHTLLALRHAYREGRVQQETLLWRAGMAAWTPLSNLPDVHVALQAAPTLDEAAQAQSAKVLLNLVEEEVHGRAVAPAAAAAPAANPAPSAARPVVAATSVVARPKARRRLWGVAAAALVAAAVGVGIWSLRPQPAPQVASAAPLPEAPAHAPVPPAPPGEPSPPAQATSSMTPPPGQPVPPPPAAEGVLAPAAANGAPKAEAPAVASPPAAPAGEEPALSPVKARRHGGHRARHGRGHRGGHHD